jgi:diguanylate cyclase
VSPTAYQATDLAKIGLPVRAPAPADELGLAARATVRVLLVEDSSPYAEMARDLLDEVWPHGLEIVWRPRLAAALETLGEREIDCVLLDLTLPDADGLSGLRELRLADPEVPVVVLTGIEDQELALKAVQDGAQDYLNKARTDGEHLRRAIRYAIERKQVEVHLARQATHDALTQLPNRTLFVERLGLALARLRRRPGQLAVLFCDLDGFKAVNDSLGHEAGDRLLVEVARRLAGAVRPTDTVARFGGDEFVVLCEDAGGGTEAMRIAERLGETISLSFALADRTLYVSPSIGIAFASHGDASPDDLLREADAAMYQAKARPGCSVEIYDAQLRHAALRRLETENELHAALERDELVLHYQPQVDLTTGRIVGVEALCRWQHPRHGLVMPAAFIDVAERCGLIARLGRWAVGRACADLERWAGEGLRISVNLAAPQLEDATLADLVRAVTAAHGLAPTDLTLELTETGIVAGDEVRQDALARLGALGVQLSLDDFGTGYASLTTLAELPFDEVKIDRSFVGTLDDPQRRRLVAGMINLTRSLDLVTVAEGIETIDQLLVLRSLGCQIGQGYLFSRPQPAETVGAWLDDGHRFGVPA